MKRHFMMSLKALCTGVMTLCVASLSLTSCYDDSALNSKIDELGNEVSALDARLQAVEALTAKLEALTARVDALYTLKFQVTTANMLQYSFDGGKTWIDTGIKLAKELECTCEIPEACKCVEVSLTDNGDSVTIKVGENEFTIKKPEEIVFDIRAGKLYFESEGTIKVALKTVGVDDVTVMSAPKGWWAEIASDGMLEITAPNYDETQPVVDYETWEETPGKYAAEGYVKIHACGANGKCMVGRLPVIVSKQPVSVKVYCDSAYFNAAGARPATFYYGATTRDSFESEVAGLLEDLNGPGWTENYPSNYSEEIGTRVPEVKASLVELLGSAPVKGTEYAVWALVEDYNKIEYTLDDFIITYYSVIEVTAEEVVAERNAYNITVNVDVQGVDSYYAYAIPGMYIETEEDLEYQKEEFLASFGPYSMWGPMGKLFTDSYTGSILDICEGTNAYMGPSYYLPDTPCYLLILPIDGRSMDEYTLADVRQFEFKTAPLTGGGSVNASAKLVTSYEYYGEQVVLDPYTEVGAELSASSDAWSSCYFYWMSAEEWADYGASDELIVKFLLEESFGMTHTDLQLPYNLVETTTPNTTMHFVAMFIDAAGKYGNIVKLSATTQELVLSDMTLSYAYDLTNLTEGALVNTTEFKFKPETSAPASSYRYLVCETTYWNPYANKSEEEMALQLHFDTDRSAITVTPEQLVEGYMVIDNIAYGKNYYVAVIAYDEEERPCAEAAIFEFECDLKIETVLTENFTNAPVAEFVVNKTLDLDNVEPYGIRYYMDSKEDFLYYYYNNYFNLTVNGNKVYAAVVNLTQNTDYADATPAVKAEALLRGDIYNPGYSEDGKIDCSLNQDVRESEVMNVVLMMTWIDAEGNFCYQETDLTPSYAEMKSVLDAAIIDGRQLKFTWEDMGSAPSCLDLGVTTPGYLSVAYDMFAVYGEDAGLPEEMRGMYMQYMGWEYEIKPTDSTSGTFVIKSTDMYGDVQTSEGAYAEYDGATCKVTFEMLYLDGAVMTVANELIPLYIEQGGAGAL